MLHLNGSKSTLLTLFVLFVCVCMCVCVCNSSHIYLQSSLTSVGPGMGLAKTPNLDRLVPVNYKIMKREIEFFNSVLMIMNKKSVCSPIKSLHKSF